MHVCFSNDTIHKNWVGSAVSWACGRTLPICLFAFKNAGNEFWFTCLVGPDLTPRQNPSHKRHPSRKQFSHRRSLRPPYTRGTARKTTTTTNERAVVKRTPTASSPTTQNNNEQRNRLRGQFHFLSSAPTARQGMASIRAGWSADPDGLDLHWSESDLDRGLTSVDDVRIRALSAHTHTHTRFNL